MKQLFNIILALLALATMSKADMTRFDMGLGTWSQTPSGRATYTENGITLGEDVSKEQSNFEFYVWSFIKHPIPILPNLRVEYVSMLNEGLISGEYGTPEDFNEDISNIEMNHFDLIFYYNLLDNLGWTTIDLGLGLKLTQINYDVTSAEAAEDLPADGTVLPVPIAYLRARVEIPSTDIGIESDIKYISVSDNMLYDWRIKTDYTFSGLSLPVEPALELGYRMKRYEVKEDGVTFDFDHQGLYFGVVGRF
jgi:outer membrane protein